LGVEDARRKPQQRVGLTLMEEFPAHRLARSSLEEDVIWYDDGGPAVNLEQGLHVLNEVELLVRGGRPEVGSVVREGLAVRLALLVDYRDARPLPERRIGEDHVRMRARLVP